MNGKIPYTELFMRLICDEEVKKDLERTLSVSKDWTFFQMEFLRIIDKYLEVELKKPVDANIGTHEAGGQFRIAFPHQAVTGNERILKGMMEHVEARKKWTEENLYHGFPDCCEIHHEIETFIYFQLPLFYWKLPGMDTAVEALLDVAHHVGSWEREVPRWYDWEKHGFTSTWVGTRAVRDFPPYDYQEANHFRFTDVSVAAYMATSDRRYLDVAEDYAGRWCSHFEKLAKEGKPLQCSIVPEGAEVTEMGHAGARTDSGKQYMVFYNTISDNTVYDIAGGLFDLYMLTKKDRYINTARLLIDHLFENGAEGRPALAFSNGSWVVNKPKKECYLSGPTSFVTECTLLARLALRHDVITGENRYKDVILRWAKQIDENENANDQMMANLMVAAHFYDGDPDWLLRGYKMALRTAAVAEKNDEFHQCNWVHSRQGTKFLMELLYQPLLGGVEWGTRGNFPLLSLEHRNESGKGLPHGVAFRTWRKESGKLGFEAVNTSDGTAVWQVGAASSNIGSITLYSEAGTIIKDNILKLEKGTSVKGYIEMPEVDRFNLDYLK